MIIEAIGEYIRNKRVNTSMLWNEVIYIDLKFENISIRFHEISPYTDDYKSVKLMNKIHKYINLSLHDPTLLAKIDRLLENE